MRTNVLCQCILVLGLFPAFASAQTDTTQRTRVSYFNYLSSGTLLAKKDEGVTVSLSTVHGIRYKEFFTGIGVGYDVYQEWRMVPVFYSIGVESVIRGKPNHFVLLQLQGGHSFVRNIPSENFQIVRYESKGGALFAPMAGYRIKKENVSLYFLIGYRFQRIQYEIDSFWNPQQRSSVKRDIQRISLHIGFGLN
jgi:hypothetical protein